MKIQLLGKRVAVEKLKKSSNKNDGFLVMVESEEFLGIVKYVGTGSGQVMLSVGQKVYFGTKFQLVRMAGSEVCVMDEENVLAVIKDENEQ